MRTLQKTEDLRRSLFELKKKGKTIGFVPTMGYLHEGHLSLLRMAKKENKVVVVSIFVNPLQFGPKEDYWRYPRDMARDVEMLKKEKADFLFAPVTKEFYSADFQTSVQVRKISQPLCGLSRPTHFGGVATVVLKLLNIAQPTAVYLGQKDYQQFRLIEKMVQDLDVPVKVRLAPIIREKDGLAMSSRNIFLSSAERKEAPFLHRALEKGRELIKTGLRDTQRIKKNMKEVLSLAPRGRLDYLEIVDAHTLEPVLKLRSSMRILIALAYYFGKTRLIDNELVTL